MYTDYLFQFEVAAMILLVAIIAAIALTMRRRPETKYQRPAEQVLVTKQDRLRVVTMNSDADPEFMAKAGSGAGSGANVSAPNDGRVQ